MLRPVFSFFGGKWRTAPLYPIPRFPRIVEPFAGGAGYALRYAGTHNVTLIEKEDRLFGAWHYLQTATPREILSLPDLEPGQSVTDLRIPQGARWLIGMWITRASQNAPHLKPGRWFAERPRGALVWGARVRERLAAQNPLIKRWIIRHGSYESAPDIEATWFIDPPYQKAGRGYRCNSLALDFQSLGEWCRSRKGQVVVCENVGADWLPFVPLVAAQSQRGLSHEAIWSRDS